MVFRLVFGLRMIPFVLMLVVGAVLFAVGAAMFAALMPLMPFALIVFAIWGLTRHSRAASAYPN